MKTDGLSVDNLLRLSFSVLELWKLPRYVQLVWGSREGSGNALPWMRKWFIHHTAFTHTLTLLSQAVGRRLQSHIQGEHIQVSFLIVLEL